MRCIPKGQTVAQDFYDIFISAKDEDRAALIDAAREMSDAEAEKLAQEIADHLSTSTGPRTSC